MKTSALINPNPNPKDAPSPIHSTSTTSATVFTAAPHPCSRCKVSTSSPYAMCDPCRIKNRAEQQKYKDRKKEFNHVKNATVTTATAPSSSSKSLPLSSLNPLPLTSSNPVPLNPAIHPCSKCKTPTSTDFKLCDACRKKGREDSRRFHERRRLRLAAGLDRVGDDIGVKRKAGEELDNKKRKLARSTTDSNITSPRTTPSFTALTNFTSPVDSDSSEDEPPTPPTRSNEPQEYQFATELYTALNALHKSYLKSYLHYLKTLSSLPNGASNSNPTPPPTPLNFTGSFSIIKDPSIDDEARVEMTSKELRKRGLGHVPLPSHFRSQPQLTKGYTRMFACRCLVPAEQVHMDPGVEEKLKSTTDIDGEPTKGDLPKPTKGNPPQPTKGDPPQPTNHTPPPLTTNLTNRICGGTVSIRAEVDTSHSLNSGVPHCDDSEEGVVRSGVLIEGQKVVVEIRHPQLKMSM
ncbi:hypothetical protein JAAARDRAFT_206890 [Jaapia argillacea MUCL 33604]|uniref:Uncharacterized protein n=1 Tax=Jaapia argillacea MUCL 33604 TaxID=933084 RepID=A0A067PTS5_9AGAM|nr:hypothetical protein JAAARDRAFT_206890 [Jaapia argillacea MUCL 33604]